MVLLLLAVEDSVEVEAEEEEAEEEEAVDVEAELEEAEEEDSVLLLWVLAEDDDADDVDADDDEDAVLLTVLLTVDSVLLTVDAEELMLLVVGPMLLVVGPMLLEVESSVLIEGDCPSVTPIELVSTPGLEASGGPGDKVEVTKLGEGLVKFGVMKVVGVREVVTGGRPVLEGDEGAGVVRRLDDPVGA